MIFDFLHNHIDELTELAIVFAVVFVSFKFIAILGKNVQNKIFSKQGDTTILGFMPLIDKVLKITVAFLAIATVLQNHGYSITSLIAGFGVTGLAVGFGAQATIANVFGSFALLSDKAYKLGDYIVISQSIQDKPVEGIVEDINLRSTKIRTADGGLVIVPNNTVATGVVKNISQKLNSDVSPNEN